MTKHFSTLLLALLVISAIIYSGCKKTETFQPYTPGTPVQNDGSGEQNSYTPPPITFTSSIMGFITDVNGKAVEGAQVKVGESSATTDNNGYYEIKTAAFTGDFCYIKAVKQGYFTASTTVHGTENVGYAANIVMMKQDKIYPFAATAGKKITLSNGAVVDFPANAIQTATGSPFNGNVNVAIAYLDPDAKNFNALIPGGDLRAYTADKRDVVLYSYGMMNIELHDDAGNMLQLAKGKKAMLEFPLPTGSRTTAPSTIPLWYFDENKGVWIEEGTARLDNGVYYGKVSHFTPWNVDVPIPPAYIEGYVVYPDGTPCKDGKITVGQAEGFVRNDGTFKDVRVISGRELIFDLKNPYTGGNMGLNIRIPATQPNETYDLGKIVLPKAYKISASLKNCDGSPFVGYAHLSSGSISHNILISGNTFDIMFPLTLESGNIYFYETKKKAIYKESFWVDPKAEGKNLGTITLCNDGTANKPVPDFKFTIMGASSPEQILMKQISLAEGSYMTGKKKSKIVFVSGTFPQDSAVLYHYGHGEGFSSTIKPNEPDGIYEPRVLIYMNSKGYRLESREITLGVLENWFAKDTYTDWTKGVFSGTFRKWNTGASTYTEMSLDNGQFTAKRFLTPEMIRR